MKALKKICFLFACLALLLICVNNVDAAVVDSGTCGSNLTWTLDDTGTLTISGTGPMTNYTSSPWSDLKAVVIEEGVTTIGEYAFAYSYNLDSVVIPNSLTSIGRSSFAGCNLKSVTIPEKVNYIADGVFSCMRNLQGIWVDGNNPVYMSDSKGVLYNKAQTTLIQAPGAISGSYTIPSGVTTIGADAFKDCDGLTGIVIANSVITIGNGAFDGCSGFDSLVIPDSVTSIGSSAFAFTNITSAIIGNGVTDIPTEAFYYADLTTLTMGNGVRTIGESAFENCYDLKTVTFGTNVTDIGRKAFYYCQALESLTIPASVTNIGQWAFWGCDVLKGIWVNENNPAYSSDSSGVLFNKDKTVLIQAPGGLSGRYTVPDSVVRIGESAFSYFSEPSSVVFGSGLTQIDQYAFQGCDTLKSVVFGSSIERIGSWVFDRCTGLKNVYYYGSESQWENVLIEYGNAPLQNATVFCNFTGDIPGDMDGDFALNDSDAMYLLRYTLFPERYPIVQSGDVNSDGKINDADAMYLLRYTLFPDRYPLYPAKEN